MNWYQAEQYVQEYKRVFTTAETIQEKIELVERYRERLYCKNPNKWRYFAILINAILNDFEINRLYDFDLDAFYWDDRICRKSIKVTPKAIVLCPIETYDSIIPVCYDTSEQDFGGLYFIASSWLDPITKHPIYGVKIGQSACNIGARIKNGYGTANPFIYHEKEHVLPYFLCPNADEKTCHHFLQSLIVQRIDKDTEWFVVTEATYLRLCELFKDKNFFAGVATGKIRAI